MSQACVQCHVQCGYDVLLLGEESGPTGWRDGAGGKVVTAVDWWYGTVVMVTEMIRDSGDGGRMAIGDSGNGETVVVVMSGCL